MKKLTINIEDSLFNTLKQKSLDETKKKGKFVSVTELVVPEIQRKFGK